MQPLPYPGRITYRRNISFTIEENTPPGSIVGYLSSSEYFDDINSNDDVTDINSDDDVSGPEAGKKTFSLVAGNAMDTFSVDSQTGALVVGGPVDFEECPLYDLVVRVFDGVGKCASVLKVEVVVVNVNDNPPQFDVDLTYITVREATPPGAGVYAATARDADGSALLYDVDESESSMGVALWLEVDDVTGHVITRRALEGAPRRMHVVITATDDVNGDVGRHVTSMTLVVTVVKDAVARCDRRWNPAVDRTQTVSVAEDAEIGSIIASAETDDLMVSSCSSVLTYSIISSNDYDTFVVDRYTGEFLTLLFKLVCIMHLLGHLIQAIGRYKAVRT